VIIARYVKPSDLRRFLSQLCSRASAAEVPGPGSANNGGRGTGHLNTLADFIEIQVTMSSSPQSAGQIAVKIDAPEGYRPVYATSGSSGADVLAYLPGGVKITIAPGCVGLIPTGLRVHLPRGHEIQVRPRSGLALKHSVTVLNTPGTIDSDFHQKIGVVLVNHGPLPFVVSDKMRIAQLVCAPVTLMVWDSVESSDLPEGSRGGFGSTGV